MSPVRRVRRVIRKIDPWTVLKVTLLLNAIGALAFVLGSIIFWSVFVNAGIPEKISEFAEKLTLSFEPDGPTYFRVVLLLSIIWTVGTTGLLTVSSLLYNLISDVVGGIEVVVLEETLVVPAQAAQQRAAAPATPKVRAAWFRRKPAPEAEVPPATGPPRPAPVPAPAVEPASAPTVEPAARPMPAAEAPAPDLPTAETPAPSAAPAVPASEDAAATDARRQAEVEAEAEVIPVEAAADAAEGDEAADEPVVEASRA